jgi:hypothetical protein
MKDLKKGCENPIIVVFLHPFSAGIQVEKGVENMFKSV